MSNKASFVLFHLLLLTPFFLLSGYVYHYFVDVYFWDTYSLIPNLVNDFNVKWLFELHNEHWIVFTKLVYWIQYKLFDGSKILIISLQIFIQIFIFYFIYFKIKDEIYDMGILSKFFILFFISVFLSSYQLAGIWHWGFAIQQQFTMLFFILSLEFYQKFEINNKKSFYALSILFAIFSAWSSANGLIAILSILIFSFFCLVLI